MIDLIIHDMEITRVKSYNEAIQFVESVNTPGKLYFDADKNRNELILRYDLKQND